ncbi:hypothetical protein [Pseudomonas aeruginosa]|uniref:hypothetical protein n=1 Tax=Pseudomonas aeruginosa TaxID=287 RepID=UPI000FF7AE83|nr:hypothetical protein [Pseudomonas aeruginosa]RWY50568.1 hypothetical protein EQH70_27605 [Pseudomonas aeruginosa]
MLREHAMYTHHCFVLACCLGAALPAPASDLFAPAELSDQELSHLRGRYVLPGRIVSFGVTMSSTWQNASGQVLGARVDLQVRQNLARPVLNVTLVDRPGDAPPPAAGNGQVLGGAGLAQTQEVSQSIRTAGDHNSASNGVSIEVRHGEAPPPLPGGTPLEGALALSGEAGTVKVTPNGGALQLAIQASGQGASLQSLGAGGLVQSVALSGNRNLVQNLAALEVMLKDRPSADPALNCAWEQLRALRPSGY